MDECDKTPHRVLSVLLSVMESGRVTVTKHGAHETFQVECSVVGACNVSLGMPPEFLSRFGFHLRLKPYDEPEFLEVCRRLLSEREQLSEELALAIGRAAWDQLGRDVRTARSLARMLKEPTLAEVQRWTDFLRKYR
jgi:MoxR-like ATPase